MDFSLVAACWGCFLETVCMLPNVVASLVVEHRLQGTGVSVVAARRLSSFHFLGSKSTGSVVVTYRLSCSAAYGILADQGLKLCLLH